MRDELGRLFPPTISPPAIEQLILAQGRRGMERLTPHLPPDYAARAAGALHSARYVLITTGFYVEGYPETDGPPGAFFLGRALAELGARVGYVGEPYILELLRAMAGKLWTPSAEIAPQLRPPDFIEFPVADTAASRTVAHSIISDRQADAVVAIERCGRTRTGCYNNMVGTNIGRWTAQVDELLAFPGIVTVAVGDGGITGELGIADPVESAADHLVLAAVSNWGAYGIVAYLSSLSGRDLLPIESVEAEALQIMVSLGAIDGFTRLREATVDGYPPEATSALLAALRRTLDRPGSSPQP
jgi:hypothetical protein